MDSASPWLSGAVLTLRPTVEPVAAGLFAAFCPAKVLLSRVSTSGVPFAYKNLVLCGLVGLLTDGDKVLVRVAWVELGLLWSLPARSVLGESTRSPFA